MKSECMPILVACLIIFTVSLSGCLETGTNSSNNGSSNNISVTPLVNMNTPVPFPEYGPDILILSRNGTSMIFDTDNLSWYQYLVTLQINNETRHEKLDVEYTPDVFRQVNNAKYNSTQTHVWNVCTDEDNASSYLIYESNLGGNNVRVEGSSWTNIQEGKRVFGSWGLSGDGLKWAREGIIPTMFDADTDSIMKQKGFETIQYKGELYGCTVYEVQVDNDTFTIWHNASLPLPPKIVADYEYPRQHLIPYFGQISSVGRERTYDLLDWGTTKENMPFPT